jgi:phosphatidylethanolamine-binding protein (PEBP) family uncharacterized protein
MQRFPPLASKLCEAEISQSPDTKPYALLIYDALYLLLLPFRNLQEDVMKVKTAISAALLVASTSLLAQTSLTVDWDWKKSHQCSQTSPVIKVSGIPADAKSLDVKMVDHDMRSFDHGGGNVPVGGEVTFAIPEGALKNYKGPCPPNFSSFGHDYEFTVRAIAADGKTELAKGAKVKTFSASAVKE